MMRTINRALLGAIFAGVLLPPNALAQSVLEEVVVTAQRREQSLQEVPISVTAFSGVELERQNIRQATDYLSLTPNVSFTEDGQQGARGLGIAVRGVNNLVTGENAFAPSIGIYLDEFSVASVPNGVANPFLPDMQRVEVLRGPQGTYFGRNAVGGALNLTTRAPTDEFGYKISVGAESYNNAGEMFTVTGIANLPLAENFKVRASLFYEDSGGLVDNVCAAGASAADCPIAAANGYTPTGEGDSGHEYIMGRVKALWDVNDDTSVTGTFIYSKEEQGMDENVPSGFLDIDTTDTFGVTAAVDPRIGAPGEGFWPNNRNQATHDLPENNELETFVGILNITHQLSEHITVKSISGLIKAEQIRLFDNDLLGGVDVVQRDNEYDGFSWSTELRMQASFDVVDITLGFMYAKDQQTQNNKVGVGASGPLGHDANPPNGLGLLPPFFPQGMGLALNHKVYKLRSIALFGDATWHATDRMDIFAGGRYSDEGVSNRLTGAAFFPGPPFACAGFPANSCAFRNGNRPTVSNKENFSDFAPRGGARYQVTDDLGVYAIISKGYKAGGTSLGYDSNNNDAALVSPFAKEKLWNFELGAKSELFDNRVRLNASVFHLEWDDLQFESFRFLTPGQLGSNFEQTISIEDADATGFEVEFLAVPTDRWTFTGGFGYLDTEITSATTAELTGGYIVNLQGLEMAKAPELTANLTGEYRWPVGANEAWVRVEYIHRDGQYSDIEGLTNQQTRGPSPNQGLTRVTDPGEFPYRSPDYDLVHIRAGFEMGNFSFNAYVQNLFDEEYYTGTQENFGLTGIRLRPHPRFFGGTVSYRFGGI